MVSTRRQAKRAAASAEVAAAAGMTAAEWIRDDDRLHRRPLFHGRGLVGIEHYFMDSSYQNKDVADWMRDGVVNDSLHSVETAMAAARRELARVEWYVDNPEDAWHRRRGAESPSRRGGEGSSWRGGRGPNRGELLSDYKARMQWLDRTSDRRASSLDIWDAEYRTRSSQRIWYYENCTTPLKTKTKWKLARVSAGFVTPWQRNRAYRALVLATKEATRWLIKHRDARVQEVAEFVPVVDVAKLVCGYLEPKAHVPAAALPSV